jgi:hypothetical protein
MGTKIVVVNVTVQNGRLQIVVNNQVVYSTDATPSTAIPTKPVDKLLACQQAAAVICAALKAVDVEVVLTPNAAPLYILS